MDEEQARLTRSLNKKLPCDVLRMIFDIYAQWDGIDNPLEKLLYICRYWSTTATQHKTLWTSFQVSPTKLEELRFWDSRISRRIEYIGDDAPIDLQL
ncbi:10618_t:CDS:1, partial [Acaulospora colombiana]